MKKIPSTLLLMILLFLVAEVAYARPVEDRRMAATFTVIHPLVTNLYWDRKFAFDVGFEYSLTPQISLEARARYSYLPKLFRVGLDTRFYPQGNRLLGWFVSGGLQLQWEFLSEIPAEQDEAQMEPLFSRPPPSPRPAGWETTLSAFAGTGYKAVFGPGPGFVVEPTLQYGWRLLHGGYIDSFDAWLWGTEGFRFRIPIGLLF